MQTFIIAIDLGHGGRDPGAVASYIYDNISAYFFKKIK